MQTYFIVCMLISRYQCKLRVSCIQITNKLIRDGFVDGSIKRKHNMKQNNYTLSEILTINSNS